MYGCVFVFTCDEGGVNVWASERHLAKATVAGRGESAHCLVMRFSVMGLLFLAFKL